MSRRSLSPTLDPNMTLTDAMWRKLESIANGGRGLAERGGVPSPTRALERRGLIKTRLDGWPGYVLTERGLDVMQARLDAERRARGGR